MEILRRRSPYSHQYPRKIVFKKTWNRMFTELLMGAHDTVSYLHTRSAISRISWGKYGARTLYSCILGVSVMLLIIYGRSSVLTQLVKVIVQKHTVGSEVWAGSPFMMTVLETSSVSTRWSVLEFSPHRSLDRPPPLSWSLRLPLLSSSRDLLSPVV